MCARMFDLLSPQVVLLKHCSNSQIGLNHADNMQNPLFLFYSLPFHWLSLASEYLPLSYSHTHSGHDVSYLLTLHTQSCAHVLSLIPEYKIPGSATEIQNQSYFIDTSLPHKCF